MRPILSMIERSFPEGATICANCTALYQTYDIQSVFWYNGNMYWKPAQLPFQHLLNAFLQQASQLYVVGGVVRDHLMESSQTGADLDLMIDQPTLPIARQVADQLGWAFYPLDEARDVARLVFTANADQPLICDVARVRGGSLEGDLLMRDFTINAMAFAVEQLGEARLIDICGGEQDLRAQIIRRVSAASLADDPVRLLRAIRFVVQFNFALDEATRLQIKQICGTITLVSSERIRDELWKMLDSDQPAQAIEALREVGLLVHLLPEVARMEGIAQSYPHFEDVYHHTLRVMQNTVALRNWVLGRSTGIMGDVTLAKSNGAKDIATIALTSAQDMTSWLEQLSPYLVGLRRHFRTPVAVGHTRASWLAWYALLHDIGKPETRTEEPQPNQTIRYRFFDHERVGAEMAEERLGALRFSRQEIALARRVTAFHMRPHLLSSSFLGQPISKRAKYRFFRDVYGTQIMNQDEHTNDGLDVLCLAIADHQAIHRHANVADERYLIHIIELLAYAFDDDGLRATKRQPLIDGHTLIQRFHLAPGRQIGQLLAMLQEAQAAGDIDTPEAALTLAEEWLQTNTATT